MVVVLLLVVVWAVLLVPPAVRSHAARREAFLLSFGPAPAPDQPHPPRQSQRVQRRRRIAGGLLVAMAATLLVGLLPTFRVLLVVHLFLVDSFLGYVALLAHMANRAGRERAPQADVSEQPAHVGAGPRRRWRPVPRPAILPDFGPVAPVS